MTLNPAFENLINIFYTFTIKHQVAIVVRQITTIAVKKIMERIPVTAMSLLRSDSQNHRYARA